MKAIKQVNRETGEIMEQVIETKPTLNADTGERGWDEVNNAMNIVTHYMSDHAESYTPAQHAEYIIKSSITRNIRATYGESDLYDKTTSVAGEITALVRGWHDSNENLISIMSGPVKVQWCSLNTKGDQTNLVADRVCIVEVPANTILHQRKGKFVMLRFKSDGGFVFNERTGQDTPITYPTSTGKDGRVWFTADLMPAGCLDGVIATYKRLEEAEFALQELSSALWVLNKNASPKDLTEVPSEWEAELAKIDLAEKKLETIQLVEPSM